MRTRRSHQSPPVLASTALVTVALAAGIAAAPAGAAAHRAPIGHHAAASSSTATDRQLLADPSKCLKRAGLGHIHAIGKDKWQGTTGTEPSRDLNASVFVQGPYASTKAATTATDKALLVQLAYAGGPFVVTATRRSYLNMEASYTAACLTSLTSSRKLHF
jgi:hypothetical protein